MIKKSIFILLAIFIYSCTDNNTKEQEVSLVYSEIEINARLKELLQQFIEENPCKNCVIKLYIDKVYEFRKDINYGSIITIYQMPFSRDGYRELDPSPILKFRIDSSLFFIYSGIEDYLNVNKDEPESAESSAEGNFANWTVIDQNDTFVIYDLAYPPFFSLPLPEDIEFYKK